MTNETARLSCQSLKEALHAVFGDHTEILESNRVPGGDINHAFRLRLSTGEKVFLKVTVQDPHYPKVKSGFPEIAFLIAS